MSDPKLRPLSVSADDDRAIRSLVAELDLPALAAQLSGRNGLHAITPWTYRLGPYTSGGVAAAGIPPLAFTDGPRGVNLGTSTAFPSASSRGASWDPELEERIGEAMGKEARAAGASALGSACVNLVRHPAWGRAQEAFGADPLHVGRLGAAHVRGVGRHVLPVVKHFALNSIENSRFYVDVRVDEATLRELYLPQFFASVDAGAGAVMTAYNRVNGLYCGQNQSLLSILREEWAFEGFTTSDFLLGTRDGSESMSAGLDQEMPQGWHYRPKRLARRVARGELSKDRLREAVTRIFRARAACGVLWPSATPTVDTPRHQELALESACSSIVVARDAGHFLPLSSSQRLGVIGPLARSANLGSAGSVSVSPAYHVSPLNGLREAFRSVLYEPRLSERAIQRLAGRVDTLVVFIGAGPRDEGEYFPLLGGGDRQSIRIPEAQSRAIRIALRSGRPTVVVWVGGGLPAFGEWQRDAPCLVFLGHGGMLGGRALAQVLTGLSIPGGHFTACIPRESDQLPVFEPRARHVRYDRYFDYRLYGRLGTAPLFWIGHGSAQARLSAEVLSFGSSAKRGLQLGADDTLEASLEITNHGPRAASPVVALYVGSRSGAADREPFELRGFAKQFVNTGHHARIQIRVPIASLKEWDATRGCWWLPAGRRTFFYSLAGAPLTPLGEMSLVT